MDYIVGEKCPCMSGKRFDECCKLSELLFKYEGTIQYY